MPLRDYECTTCGNIFDEWQVWDAEMLPLCPKCGGETQRSLCCPSPLNHYNPDHRYESMKEQEGEDTNASQGEL